MMHLGHLHRFPCRLVVLELKNADSVVVFVVEQKVAETLVRACAMVVAVALVYAVDVYRTALQLPFRCVGQIAISLEKVLEAYSASAEE